MHSNSYIEDSIIHPSSGLMSPQPYIPESPQIKKTNLKPGNGIVSGELRTDWNVTIRSSPIPPTAHTPR